VPCRLVDPDSTVQRRAREARKVCILCGTGGDTCQVDWVDRDSFVEPGNALVAASLAVEQGSRLRLPDGLPAAQVVKVEKDAMKPLFYAVEAEPLVNVNRLEYVEILVPAPRDGT
jgi:cell shape-determining protein MreC